MLMLQCPVKEWMVSLSQPLWQIYNRIWSSQGKYWQKKKNMHRHAVTLNYFVEPKTELLKSVHKHIKASPHTQQTWSNLQRWGEEEEDHIGQAVNIPEKREACQNTHICNNTSQSRHYWRATLEEVPRSVVTRAFGLIYTGLKSEKILFKKCIMWQIILFMVRENSVFWLRLKYYSWQWGCNL